MKTRVINLVGASGTGKTTIAKELEKTGYNVIQSYTTRPPRYKNEWGHTFIDNWLPTYERNRNNNLELVGFCNDIHWKNDFYYISKDDMIAYFNSYNSGHHYFATDEQVIRGKDNIYVVDPAGAEMVRNYYKGTDVEAITIFLQADKEVRRERMIKRGTPTLSQLRSGKTYLHQELLKETSDRLRKDDNIFGVAKCDYAVSANRGIDITTEWIREILEA